MKVLAVLSTLLAVAVAGGGWGAAPAIVREVPIATPMVRVAIAEEPVAFSSGYGAPATFSSGYSAPATFSSGYSTPSVLSTSYAEEVRTVPAPIPSMVRISYAEEPAIRAVNCDTTPVVFSNSYAAPAAPAVLSSGWSAPALLEEVRTIPAPIPSMVRVSIAEDSYSAPAVLSSSYDTPAVLTSSYTAPAAPAVLSSGWSAPAVLEEVRTIPAPIPSMVRVSIAEDSYSAPAVLSSSYDAPAVLTSSYAAPAAPAVLSSGWSAPALLEEVRTLPAPIPSMVRVSIAEDSYSAPAVLSTSSYGSAPVAFSSYAAPAAPAVFATSGWGASAAPVYAASHPHIPMLRFDHDIQGGLSDAYSFQTGNGISMNEETRVVAGYGYGTRSLDSYGNVLDSSDSSLVKTGSYSYISPEGIPITTRWVADENGFRAEGDHLPVDVASDPAYASVHSAPTVLSSYSAPAAVFSTLSSSY